MAFDNVKLDKGLYCAGKSFTKALEQADPGEQYCGTALEGLDAYERQLKRFGIRVSGSGSDRVEKFFQNADTAVLFPEFVARTVERGLKEASKLESIVAATTQIDGNDYRSAGIEADNTPGSPTTEGEALGALTIRSKNSLVDMQKFGSVLNVTYETLRYQRLELLGVFLRKVGKSFAINMLDSAVNVLRHGDGTPAEAAPTISRAGGALTYGDLISLWGEFRASGTNLTTLLTNNVLAQEILALPEMRDGTAGLDFHGSGNLVTPLGAELVVCPAFSGNDIVGVDRNTALEMVEAGGIITDYDRLIDRQFHRSGISTTVGFSKIFPHAAVVLQ